MKSLPCCRPESAPADERQPPPSALRRFRHAAEWAIPGVILFAMPKCPLCLAVYVALFTGVGLSFSAAAHLRILVLILCASSLAALAVKHCCALAWRRNRA